MPSALTALVAAAAVLDAASAQQVGTMAQEAQPSMSMEVCGKSGCAPDPAKVVMDMNWRWLHNKDGYNNCLPDGADAWDQSLCSDPEKCSRNCAIEGIDAKGYSETYMASTVGEDGLKLTFPKAPRVYLNEPSGDRYKVIKLLNREFSFDVDVSTLPCGMNAALYFVEMPADGDKGGANNAGAKFGTGYCDAQCPHMKFIKDKANIEGWKSHMAKTPDDEWRKVGPEGSKGVCCAEMDIFEANREAGAFTAHPCKHPAQAVCEGDEECGNKDTGDVGWCDKDGCGFSTYRLGHEKFWGAGDEYTVDTTRPMTIVTQFVTTDGTDDGDLKEIRRFYIQDGKVIKNPKAKTLNASTSAIDDAMCQEQLDLFNTSYRGFTELGGLKAMGGALKRGMVLSMSIWDDDFGRMLWLDAEKSKLEEDPADPGVRRGPCPFDYGTDKDMKEYTKKHGPVEVTFSKLRVGEIGTTTTKQPKLERKYSLTPSMPSAHTSWGPAVMCGIAAAVAMLVVMAGRRTTEHAAAELLLQPTEPEACEE